jgi:hypothetical protein
MQRAFLVNCNLGTALPSSFAIARAMSRDAQAAVKRLSSAWNGRISL